MITKNKKNYSHQLTNESTPSLRDDQLLETLIILSYLFDFASVFHS